MQRTRTPKSRRTASILGCLLVLLTLAWLPGCGQRAKSPDELLQRIAELNSEGRVKEIWALYTDQARDEFRASIENLKSVIERNPDPVNLKLVHQFKITREELYTLPVIEIFARDASGWERALEGAKVVDTFPSPADPAYTIVTWTSDATKKPQQMICQEQKDGTWLLYKLRAF